MYPELGKNQIKRSKVSMVSNLECPFTPVTFGTKPMSPVTFGMRNKRVSTNMGHYSRFSDGFEMTKKINGNLKEISKISSPIIADAQPLQSSSSSNKNEGQETDSVKLVDTLQKDEVVRKSIVNQEQKSNERLPQKGPRKTIVVGKAKMDSIDSTDIQIKALDKEKKIPKINLDRLQNNFGIRIGLKKSPRYLKDLLEDA